MAVTKGRYQTRQGHHRTTPFKWSVVDMEGKTLGEQFVCACDTEEKASHIASALNFNNKPSNYGYKLVD